MMVTADMRDAGQTDAELVAGSLTGSRDSYRRIIERYQTLICSIAYSATGSLTTSDDLAQETFVIAWQRLSELREPAKLRCWLCGIVRFRIGKELRQQGHEPAHGAESLDEVSAAAAPEPLPSDQMISKEEGAILWRSLERIPETYREPMVLFYREEQSIQRVAQALELSEDAVKQRLSRGRKLLQEEMLSFVEGALKRTAPGVAFTLGVMSALPLLAATSASAATVTAVAAKGSATGKTATGAAAMGAILTGGAILMFSVLGFLAFMGSCFGYLMSRACRKSRRQLDYVTRAWRTIALGFLVFVIPALALGYWGPEPARFPALYHALTFWMALVYPLVLVALAVWLWQWKREPRHEGKFASAEHPEKKRLTRWVGAAMLVPVCVCALLIHAMVFHGTYTSQRLPEAEAQRIIFEKTDATFTIEQSAKGSKILWIKLLENGKTTVFWTAANTNTLALLAEKKAPYTTRTEGRDFHYLGKSGRWLPLLSFFIAPMGAVLFLRRFADRRRASNGFSSATVLGRNAADQ